MGINDNTSQIGYCLYAHINPVNDKVYIGISKDVKKRWRNKGIGYRKCTIIWQAFQKYGWDNFVHVVICDGLTKEEACRKEKQWIYAYKRDGYSYNITDGGEGTAGMVRSDKHKQILRERMTGRYVSPETRSKLSKTLRELHLSGKKVFAFDIKTKELVNVYPTVRDASVAVGINPNNISRAANGGRPSAGGFIWSFTSFIDKNNPYYNNIGRANRKIYCYDLHGNFIKEYKNSKEAAQAVNGTLRGVDAVCAGERTSYHHYIWKYELCKIGSEILKRIRFKRHETNRS